MVLIFWTSFSSIHFGQSLLEAECAPLQLRHLSGFSVSFMLHFTAFMAYLGIFTCLPMVAVLLAFKTPQAIRDEWGNPKQEIAGMNGLGANC